MRTIGPKSFLFGTVQYSPLSKMAAVNYDYIITNSINSLLIGSRCIPNSAHTNLGNNLVNVYGPIVQSTL